MSDVGFWKMASDAPAWLAVVEPDGTEMAAGELLASANQLVHGLRALGLAKGACIATVLDNSAAMLEAFLAAHQAGWYLTPINWHLTAPEIAYILEDSDAAAVIATPRVGHDREAEGCAAAPERRASRGGRDPAGPLPLNVRDHAGQPRRPPRRRAALPHCRPQLRHQPPPPRPHPRPDGQVGARGDARQDPAPPRDVEPHGADPVQPAAQAARRDAREVRRLIAAPHDPQRRALPGRHQAPDARVVGTMHLRVLRGLGGGRHAGEARGVAEEAGHGRQAVADPADPA